MFELTEFNELPLVLASVLLIFFLLYFLYKKYILSIFDPLFFFLITQAFSIELGFLFIKNNFFLINFLLTHAAYHVGFFITAQKKQTTNEGTLLRLNNMNEQQLSIFVLSSFVFILFFNALFFAKNGFVLFSDNPSADKVDLYQKGGGMGVVRRINWGIIYLTGFLSLYLFIKKEKLIYLFIWLLLVFVISVSGSKGAIIYFLFGIGLLTAYSDVKTNRFYPILKKLIFFGVIAGIVIAFAVILFSSTDDTSAVLTLVNRFLFFADAIFFYYSNDSLKFFSYLNFTDFLSYEFNSTLGFLRLAEYKVPLGFELVKYSLSDVKNFEPTFGPNVPFYVKGYIYFGYLGGIFYAAFVGVIVAFFRNLLMKTLNKKTTTIVTLVIVFINIGLFSFCQDSALYFNTFFDTILFSIPFVILSFILINPYIFKRVNLATDNNEQ